MLGSKITLDQERLEIFHDASTGVTGIVAIDSTLLGPAMGGLRLNAYATLDEAVEDACRLASAMTLKNAAAGLDLGGGKAVLLDDGGWSSPVERASRMRAVGRLIDQLGGRYVTAEDVGTTPQDMDEIATQTAWVAGGSRGQGDPSPATARTVFASILAAARHRFQVADLAGLRIAVQGVGHVGGVLVALLRGAGAEVLLTDANADRAAAVASRNGAIAVPPAELFDHAVDVFAPCALGGVITCALIPSLRCSIVAGAANNQLAEPEVAEQLHRAGILYVPDFLANCGGIIHVGSEVMGIGTAEVERLTCAAIARTEALLHAADRGARSPLALAVETASARIDAAAGPAATGVRA